MSAMTEKSSKPYPEDLIEPKDLPDEAPSGHPIPWEFDSGGNGHIYVYDANKVKVAHVYCYASVEITQLENKLSSINGARINVRDWL